MKLKFKFKMMSDDALRLKKKRQKCSKVCLMFCRAPNSLINVRYKVHSVAYYYSTPNGTGDYLKMWFVQGRAPPLYRGESRTHKHRSRVSQEHARTSRESVTIHTKN
jgi:hypothetical protein